MTKGGYIEYPVGLARGSRPGSSSANQAVSGSTDGFNVPPEIRVGSIV